LGCLGGDYSGCERYQNQTRYSQRVNQSSVAHAGLLRDFRPNAEADRKVPTVGCQRRVNGELTAS